MMAALRLVAGAGNIWVVKTIHGVVCDSPKKTKVFLSNIRM